MADKVKGTIKPFTKEKRRQLAESLLRLPVDPPGLMPFEGLLSYIQRLNKE